MLKELNNFEIFKDILKNYSKVVVGFYSPRCIKCKELAYIFTEKEKLYSNCAFIRINVLEENSNVFLEKYSIRSPTLCLFKNGDLFKKYIVESNDKKIIIDAVEDFLK